MTRRRSEEIEAACTSVASLETLEQKRAKRRAHYKANKEELKAYQREYSKTHKRKPRTGHGKSGNEMPRELVRITYTSSDIVHAPPEKSLKILEMIIQGKVLFVG